MELNDFIAGTIQNIIEGVSRAQEYASQKQAIVNPNATNLQGDHGRMLVNSYTGRLVQVVEFDVALTSSDGTSTRGGIGVVLGAVALGSQGASEQAKGAITRIKFQVPVVLPENIRPEEPA